MRTIKAISMWEPWASLVRTGAKTWETRSWSTKYRGELLICAAQRKHLGDLIFYLSCWPFQGGLAPLVGKPLDMKYTTWAGVKIEDLHFGMAVAIVNLVDCRPVADIPWGEVDREKHFGNFLVGRFGWKFEDLQVIEPFSVKGHQGFFNVQLT